MFNQNCHKTFSESCSKDIIDKSSLSWNDISKCVQSSFSGTGKDFLQNDNTILARSRTTAKSLVVSSSPNVYFNEALYKGSLALSDLTMTICGLLNQEVEECHEIPMTDLEDLDITKLVLIMVACFLVGLVILGVLCKKIAKRKYLRFGK